jgi:hypothetical protein
MRDVTAAVAKQSGQKQQGTLESSQKRLVSTTMDKSGFLPLRLPSATKEISKNPAYAPVAIECYGRRGLAV